jgi:hypothetical protein
MNTSVRWARHVAYMVEMKKAYKIIFRQPEGIEVLGRLQHRWESNIKMCRTEIGSESVDWIHLTSG